MHFLPALYAEARSLEISLRSNANAIFHFIALRFFFKSFFKQCKIAITRIYFSCQFLLFINLLHMSKNILLELLKEQVFFF